MGASDGLGLDAGGAAFRIGTQAGGVDEEDRNGDVRLVLCWCGKDGERIDPVAGGAGEVGGDGYGAAVEGVGQGGLAGIGRADEHNSWRRKEMRELGGAV